MQMTKAFGRVFLDAGADLLHHLEVDAEQVVAAHAGLARHAGRDDADIGALDRRIVVDAGQARVEAVDRGGLRDVEGLALRDAFGDIEQDDVAEFLQPDQMGERAANHPGPDEGDLVACHVGNFPFVRNRPRTGAAGIVGPEGGGDASRIRVRNRPVARNIQPVILTLNNSIG